MGPPDATAAPKAAAAAAAAAAKKAPGPVTQGNPGVYGGAPGDASDDESDEEDSDFDPDGAGGWMDEIGWLGGVEGWLVLVRDPLLSSHFPSRRSN